MDDTPIYRELTGERYRDPPTEPFRALPGVLGVDVSRYQGAPDWARARSAGYQFAYIKASQGNSSIYSTSNPQFNGASANGIIAGLYHYGDPSKSPQDNATAFAKQLKRINALDSATTLPPCLDLEIGSGDLSQWTSEFFTELRNQCSIERVMLYSGVDFFTRHIGEAWMDANILLWMAHYGEPPGQPGYMSPRVAIHQYSQTGSVPGIGTVDLSYAIWPLSLIVDSEDTELTDDEHKMLVAVWQFLSGGVEVGQWPGWQTWPGGTDERLSATDFLRRGNVETRQVYNEIKSLQDDMTALKGLVTQWVNTQSAQ